jgi:hypothetical protein
MTARQVDYGNGAVDRYGADNKVVPYPCPDCGEIEPLFREPSFRGTDTWACMSCLMHRLRDDVSPNGRKAAILTELVLEGNGLGPSDQDRAIGDLEGTSATS